MTTARRSCTLQCQDAMTLWCHDVSCSMPWVQFSLGTPLDQTCRMSSLDTTFFDLMKLHEVQDSDAQVLQDLGTTILEWALGTAILDLAIFSKIWVPQSWILGDLRWWLLTELGRKGCGAAMIGRFGPQWCKVLKGKVFLQPFYIGLNLEGEA